MSFKRRLQASVCQDNSSFCLWAVQELRKHDQAIRRSLYEALMHPAVESERLPFPDIGVPAIDQRQDECFGYVRIKLPASTSTDTAHVLLSAFMGGALRQTMAVLEERPFDDHTAHTLLMKNSRVRLLVELALRWQIRSENPYAQPPTIDQQELFERRDISAFQRVLEIEPVPLQ